MRELDIAISEEEEAVKAESSTLEHKKTLPNFDIPAAAKAFYSKDTQA
jgi:hypothetical protein